MATYAIGDVQGCNRELGDLLARLRLRADADRLWFVGDLVNRGPDSLGVLRRLHAMRDNIDATLGNHDLHLLAVALGARRPKRGDTLDAVLAAPDAERLLEWLGALPLLHESPQIPFVLVHAGLPPQWDIDTARACARSAELALRKHPTEVVESMYGNEPSIWSERLQGADRIRFIINAFTRLRYVDERGHLDLDEKGPPSALPPGLVPWYAHRAARWRGTRIIFGHWSALGWFENADVVSLDTGCVWGKRLTALRIDVPDSAPISVGCTGAA